MHFFKHTFTDPLLLWKNNPQCKLLIYCIVWWKKKHQRRLFAMRPAPILGNIFIRVALYKVVLRELQKLDSEDNLLKMLINPSHFWEK